MGLFSKKPSDTKARIEELKKKIQAEQQAYAQSADKSANTPAPIAPPVAPVEVVAPVAPPVQPAPVVQAPVAPPIQAPVAPVEPAPIYQAPVAQPTQAPAPVYQTPPPRVYAPAVVERPRAAPPAPRYDLTELEEIKTGIVLDLGEGMSLNVPIKGRMHLDEFLHIADRVRELQRLQQPRDRWQ